MQDKINKCQISPKEIETLNYQLTLDGFALLKFFGYKGKIKNFTAFQIIKEVNSLKVVDDFIEKCKSLCAIEGISDEQVIRTQKLTFSILNSILANINTVSNCDLYGKYIEHIDKLTKLITGTDLETKNCVIDAKVKTDYILKLLKSAEKSCVNGFNDDNYKLSSKIINKTMREVFLGKYGKDVRQQVIKRKDDVKQILSYQRCNKKIHDAYNPSGVRRVILENILS